MSQFDVNISENYAIYHCRSCTTPVMAEKDITARSERYRYLFVPSEKCINIERNSDVIKCRGCNHRVGNCLNDIFDVAKFIVRFEDFRLERSKPVQSMMISSTTKD